MKRKRLPAAVLFLLLMLIAFFTAVICISIGSVSLPLGDTLTVLWYSLLGWAVPEGMQSSIILNLRLPRVLCVALTGASLSLAGAAMQGLLRNPLADGSTMGVSSGASLGAIFAILIGFQLPAFPFSGTMLMAVTFAFLSLLLILSLAWILDRSMSTNTMILIGVIFTMFSHSVISLLIAFAGTKLQSITFWTMGSLSSSTLTDALILLISLLIFGTILLSLWREMNAFAIGEENAQHVGVNIRRVKLVTLISASCLIGVCVSIGGNIGFVGLVVPHMARLTAGANHKRLLPVSMIAGAIFLMLCDLTGRTILSPIELPIGVVTSLIGSVAFVIILLNKRKAGR